MLDISDKDLAALKRYESLRVTKEEAREIVIKEIQAETPDMGMSEFIKAGVNEAAAKILINTMIDGAVKRIQLVSAFGLDAFMEAGEIVSDMPDVDIFNAIDLLEQELVKQHTNGI